MTRFFAPSSFRNKIFRGLEFSILFDNLCFMGTKHNLTLLLSRWHQGDRQALNKLLALHMDWLKHQMHLRMTPALRAKAETMDFVQEALLGFLENAPRFRIQNGKLFRALLLRIAENSIKEHYRWWAAKRRQIARERPLPPDTVLSLESPSPTPWEKADSIERKALVQLGLEFLEPKDLRVIVLRDYEAKSFEEIGKSLGKSSAAAKMQYRRAVEKLGQIVAKLRAGRMDDLLHQVS